MQYKKFIEIYQPELIGLFFLKGCFLLAKLRGFFEDVSDLLVLVDPFLGPSILEAYHHIQITSGNDGMGVPKRFHQKLNGTGSQRTPFSKLRSSY